MKPSQKAPMLINYAHIRGIMLGYVGTIHPNHVANAIKQAAGRV